MIWKINHVVEKIKLPPVHDCCHRDWNQRAVIVEYALQRSLGSNNTLAPDLS